MEVSPNLQVSVEDQMIRSPSHSLDLADNRKTKIT